MPFSAQNPTNTTVLDPNTSSKPKVGFVSLGCPKNLVDSEVMMGLLHYNGAELTPRAEDAEIIVINTCSFIDSAKQESVNTILEMVQHKQQNGGKAQRIVVAGCLVERYRDEIRKNIPEVDAVVGTGELEAILAAAGLTPSGHTHTNSPFNILPQGTPEATIHTHAIGMVETNTEVTQLIDRAPSAVSQHSRPLPDPEHDREIAPQLRIVQSLAETGTTHGDEPLNHTGDHIAHLPGSLPIGIDPGNTSRPEGDLRQQQGRFSRASWDGATAALPEYLYNDATPRILTTPRASAYIKIAEGCDHPCSFCIIPQLRGKFRSRRMSSIIAKAENLSNKASARSHSSARTPPATAKTSASPTASPHYSTRSHSSPASAGSAFSTPTPTKSPRASSRQWPSTTPSQNISTSHFNTPVQASSSA